MPQLVHAHHQLTFQALFGLVQIQCSVFIELQFHSYSANDLRRESLFLPQHVHHLLFHCQFCLCRCFHVIHSSSSEVFLHVFHIFAFGVLMHGPQFYCLSLLVLVFVQQLQLNLQHVQNFRLAAGKTM